MEEIGSDFDAIEVARNFVRFLRGWANVMEIGRSEHAIINSYGGIPDPHRYKEVKGLKKPISLNGKQIGYLEYYANPRIIAFRGELPDIETAKTKKE